MPKVFVRVLERERVGAGDGLDSETIGVFMLEVECGSGARDGFEDDRDLESDIMIRSREGDGSNGEVEVVLI